MSSASVSIKDGTLNFALITPFMAPIPIPMASATMIIRITLPVD